MIKLFAGTDDYESYQKASKEAQKLADETGSEVEVFNADESKDVNELLLKAEGVGMFAENKVIIAKRLLSNKKYLEFFSENYAQVKNLSIIIWHDSKADGKLKLVKQLKNDKNFINFDLPKIWQLENWVEGILKAKNIKLTKTQVGYVLERTFESKWLIINSLIKVNLFLKGINSNTLTDDQLALLMGTGSKGDIWKFLDYFGERKFAEAMNELSKLLQYEQSIQYLMAMINRELELMTKVLYAKNNNINTKELGLHPFVLQKTIKKASNFNLEHLVKLGRSLLNLDFGIKSGELNEVLGFKLFMFGIDEKFYI